MSSPQYDEEGYIYSEDDELEYQYSDIDDDDDDFGGSSKEETLHTGPGTGSSSYSLGNSIGASTGNGYKIIDLDELETEQNRIIQEIASVLDIDLSSAGILLRYYAWNKEKLFDHYCASPEDTKKKAGVYFLGKPAQALPVDQKVECHICCEVYKSKDVLGMGCGHRFCLDCWRPYISLKIAEGPSCVYSTCPAQGCREVITDQIFKILTTSNDFKKYRKYAVNSYVDINKSVKWCPAPGCEHAVVASDGSPMVQCVCGYHFCMRCGEESHLPVSCDSLAKWLEKCRNESETANWILANTKKCPKCSIRIEKNQGCNHMTCRHCKHDFCWICLGDWSDHGTSTGGYYKCNRYEAGATEDTDAARAKAELDRYLHYYQRFANHAEAGKFAARIRESTEKRMVELQESTVNASWIDVQFLKSATEQLIECRRILQYTYVFAYYLPNGKEKNLFEYLQENLEKNTEHLTGLSEMPLEKLDRSEIVNYTRVTDKFLNNLIAGVEEGLTEVHQG